MTAAVTACGSQAWAPGDLTDVSGVYSPAVNRDHRGGGAKRGLSQEERP